MIRLACTIPMIGFMILCHIVLAQIIPEDVEVKLEENLEVVCTEASTYYGLDFLKEEKWREFLEDFTGYLEVPHMNGSTNALIKYKNGLNDGPFYVWSKNNNLISHSNYIDGKLEGYKFEWYDSGTMASEAYYSKGLREKLYRVYSIEGDLETEIKYVNGEIKSEKRYYKGKIQTNYVIKDGHKYGVIGSGYCFSKHKK